MVTFEVRLRAPYRALMLRLFGARNSSGNGRKVFDVGGSRRIYAVGDLHGRYDLFIMMLRAIEDDLAASDYTQFEIIFLGDLIDRGPQSAEVLELASKLARKTRTLRFLQGNHEEAFLRAYDGDARACEFYLRIGGEETLQSYGLQRDLLNSMTGEEVVEWMQSNIPFHHVDFLRSTETMILAGDYAFVHAGVRPKIPLENQTPSDLRWIKSDFTRYGGAHPAMIVHGHSITEKEDEQSNRIGIDTGAYDTGLLTAVVLQGVERRFLKVLGADASADSAFLKQEQRENARTENFRRILPPDSGTLVS